MTTLFVSLELRTQPIWSSLRLLYFYYSHYLIIVDGGYPYEPTESASSLIMVRIKEGGGVYFNA